MMSSGRANGLRIFGATISEDPEVLTPCNEAQEMHLWQAVRKPRGWLEHRAEGTLEEEEDGTPGEPNGQAEHCDSDEEEYQGEESEDEDEKERDEGEGDLEGHGSEDKKREGDQRRRQENQELAQIRDEEQERERLAEKAEAGAEFQRYIEQAWRCIQPAFNAAPNNCTSAAALSSTPDFINVEAKFDLKPHQLEGIGRLLQLEESHNAWILGDDMGLGKTAQVVTLIAQTMHLGRTLLIVPLATLNYWVREIRDLIRPELGLNVLEHHGSAVKSRNAHDIKNYHVVVTTYDVIRNEFRLDQQLFHDFRLRQEGATTEPCGDSTRPLLQRRQNLPLLVTDFYRVVLDEGHHIRNDSTTLSRACKSIRAQKRGIMTGTPFNNEYTDIRSLYEFLQYSPWHNRSFFRPSFLLKQPRTSARETAVLSKERNAWLAASLQVIMVRRMKTTVFDGSPICKPIKITRTDIHVKPDQEEATLQKLTRLQWDPVARRAAEARRNAGMESGFLSKRETLQAITRCRIGALGLMCCNARYGEKGSEDLDEDSYGNVIGQQLSRAEKEKNATRRSNFQDSLRNGNYHSTKIDFATTLISNLIVKPGKILVFCFSLSALDALEVSLEEEYNIKCLRYDGMKSTTEKLATENEFRSEHPVKVLLITSGCGSEGLNLTVANKVIILAPQWNPFTEEQCIMRSARMGQDEDVEVYRIILKHSIEKLVLTKATRKSKKGLNLTDESFNSDNSQWAKMAKWDLQKAKESFGRIGVHEDDLQLES
ncbi:hypothetical protein K402DRAFT_456084 [Aulographum hederae CBS 113979]|uniref:P-loop containing nucleoside triphosphate hydrolase protein n=1 Tax=Aulographum hederae CBS 113979 TaxID=1176131 RepID=A0A6G1GT27_9PEZI|nr:hypothetical protein K402DRAFT_456084 [Aulographum hederae CBS 113979]